MNFYEEDIEKNSHHHYGRWQVPTSGRTKKQVEQDQKNLISQNNCLRKCTHEDRTNHHNFTDQTKIYYIWLVINMVLQQTSQMKPFCWRTMQMIRFLKNYLAFAFFTSIC